MYKDYTGLKSRPVMTSIEFINKYPNCIALFLFPGKWDTNIQDEKFEVLGIASVNEYSKLKTLKNCIDSIAKSDIN